MSDAQADNNEALALVEAWRTKRPDVALSVTRAEDCNAEWDGDGPHPGDDGYVAYEVTVTAHKIVNGELHKGFDYLCGTWMRPDEPLGTVHGYLSQMIDAAVQECDEAVERTQSEVQ